MPTIALVDDDRNILTSVSIALEAEGYRIMTYTDGASALDGFRTTQPDLAILDIKMPRMDGMETLRRLRQKSDLPVIFLTSRDDEADEAKDDDEPKADEVDDAKPKKTKKPDRQPASNCDPNYSGACVPIVGWDLDCGDIGESVTVEGTDIHRFDADGDGSGCESY